MNYHLDISQTSHSNSNTNSGSSSHRVIEVQQYDVFGQKISDSFTDINQISNIFQNIYMNDEQCSDDDSLAEYENDKENMMPLQHLMTPKNQKKMEKNQIKRNPLSDITPIIPNLNMQNSKLNKKQVKSIIFPSELKDKNWSSKCLRL